MDDSTQLNNADTSTEQAIPTSEIILDILNNMFSSLFSSIDNTIYSLLDNIVFLDASSIITNSIENLFFSDKFNLLILSNILIGCVFTYRIIRIVLSIYTSQDTELPYFYILKSVVIIICMNCCLFICEQILEINYLITQYLMELGKYLFDEQISFLSFSNIINSYISSTNEFNIFSIEGIIQSLVTFGSITLLLSYILRYILIKLLIICSPFAFLCLLHDNLHIYFYNWIKYLMLLLLTQNFICIALYLPHILDFDNSLYSKFLIIGTILFLYQLNNYIKEFMGGFSISNNVGVSSSILRSMKGK